MSLFWNRQHNRSDGRNQHRQPGQRQAGAQRREADGEDEQLRHQGSGPGPPVPAVEKK
jgi:hypothetical protein